MGPGWRAMTGAAPLRKADFDGIYNQDDARAYFTTLAPFGYEIPQHGADLFHQLLGAREPAYGRRPTVLDVCCSYGVGGALLTTDLRLEDLYAHYRDAQAQGLSGERLAEFDRQLFARHRLPHPLRVVGLDVADRAVAYALDIGAMDAGAVEDLETSDPSDRLAEELRAVDLVTTTGGVGYVGEKTFGRIADHVGADAWVAAFCLRAYGYGPIADALADRGLRTERAAPTFVQRRFIDATEREWAVSEVRARGLDTAGKEDAGCYHAELYVSRPADQVAARPLEQLLPGLAQH